MKTHLLLGASLSLLVACVPDTPEDRLQNSFGNGNEHQNELTSDLDQDGIDDRIDKDDDGDGVNDPIDLFPRNSLEHKDSDGDGIGDNSDEDDDNDGVPDTEDQFPFDASEYLDTDQDGIGNQLDSDDDGDSVPDHKDQFPLNPLEFRDTDGDGLGDNIDKDDDNDGYPDIIDALPLDNRDHRDDDEDGIGNSQDKDSDNDGVDDSLDAFPFDPLESADNDQDGVGDNADPDDDNDSVPDIDDDLPFDPRGSVDSDGDSIPNNLDNDDDNDGVDDSEDLYPLDRDRSSDNPITDPAVHKIGQYHFNDPHGACYSCHIDNKDGTFISLSTFKTLDINELKYPSYTSYSDTTVEEFIHFISNEMNHNYKCDTACFEKIGYYLWSFKSVPSPIVNPPKGDVEEGKHIFTAGECLSCHQLTSTGGFTDTMSRFHSINDLDNASSYEELVNFIATSMPAGNSSNCVDQCAIDTATFLWDQRIPNEEQQTVYALNFGANLYTSKRGNQFENGLKYVSKISNNANHFTSGVNVKNTSDLALYQSYTTGIEMVSLPVSEARYDIVIKTQEPFYAVAGARVVDIHIEDTAYQQNLDVFDLVGRYSAYDIVLRDVLVQDGELNIEFLSESSSVVSAILVVSTDGEAAFNMDCAQSGAFLCVDFEAGIPEEISAGESVAVVDSLDADRGNALRFNTANSANAPWFDAMISVKNVPTTHWGRMFYNIASVDNGGSELTHVTLASFSTDSYLARFIDTEQNNDTPAQHRYRYKVQSTPLIKNDIETGYVKQTNADYIFDSNWVCLEWRLDGQANTFHLYRNGNLIDAVSGSVLDEFTGPTTNFQPLPSLIQTLYLGGQIFTAANAEPQVGMIDDIVLSQNRVNCQE